MSIEQRLEQVEKQTKRLRIAVVVLAAALCGVVSMAATGDIPMKLKAFDVEAGRVEADTGKFRTIFAERIAVKNDEGDIQVLIGAPSGYTGGDLRVMNKEGKTVITLGVDDYGNGEIGVYNRKGQGRAYKSQ